MLVTEHRASGLIVARDGMDETSVTRALKQLDPRLVLQKHPRDDAPNGHVYKVICIVSDEYAPVVFTWTDDHGQPLPLSHALVETLQSLTSGARNKPLGEDEFNHRRNLVKERDAERDREAIMDDHRPYIERGRVSVGMSGSKPRYWRREKAKPASGAKR